LRLSCGLSGITAGSDNDICVELHKLARQSGKSLEFAVGESPLEDEVPAVEVAEFAPRECPVGCAPAASGAAKRLAARTTARPIRRMGTSAEDWWSLTDPNHASLAGSSIRLPTDGQRGRGSFPVGWALRGVSGSSCIDRAERFWNYQSDASADQRQTAAAPGAHDEPVRGVARPHTPCHHTSSPCRENGSHDDSSLPRRLLPALEPSGRLSESILRPPGG
jgi:hypothetical protein